MAKKPKIYCKRVPEAPGTKEPSKLFIDLQKMINNRPLANYVYSCYLLDGVAESMTAAGYTKVNSQNQHRAADVFAFFDVGAMKNQLDVSAQAKSFGFVDSANNLVELDAEEAYTKAQSFNQNSKGSVAYVVQNGDKFNVLVIEKDSRTIGKQVEVSQSLVAWNKLSELLTAEGVDIAELSKISPALVNPGSIQRFLKVLSYYKFVENDVLVPKDIELLLAINKNIPVVRNVISRGWGDFGETAKKIFDTLHSPTPSGIAFITNLLNQIKQIPAINVTAVTDEVRTAVSDFQASDDTSNAQKILNELDKKYKINNDIIVKTEDEIQNYSDAYVEAIFSLERQIRTIEARSGRTDKSEALANLKSQLYEELKKKQYARGLMDFFSGAANYFIQVNNSIEAVSKTGTNMEYAHSLADAIAQANNLRDAYYRVIQAIADSPLVNDFSTTNEERDELKALATDLKQKFDSLIKKIRDLEREGMRAIGQEFIGTHNALYGKDLADIINMAEADSSIMDYLYSIGRSSNVVVSMLGAIVRDAQMDRDNQLADIALRIRRANHLLMDDGKDSSFIYDEKGRIKSEYDWDAYREAKDEYVKVLKGHGFVYGTFEFYNEVKAWEEQNTHEVEVDAVSHRTERMPNFYLTTNFREGWSTAQNEYYDRMMQLKGEIGTLLPAYAQHQYVAPQKRTTWDQVLKEALNGTRDFNSVYKWWSEKIKNWNVARAGDSKFRSSGLYIGGDEALATLGDYDNSILRQIPIFYVQKIDANDLSHDFSSAMQSLASTALNYSAMNSIKNIAEMMTDYSLSKTAPERDSSGRIRMDVSTSEDTMIAKTIRKVAQSNNVSTILDAFTLKHIYGHEHKTEGKWAVFCSNLIGYTSFKGLALNKLGALTNKYVGVIQSLIRATGGQYYNIGDFMKAYGVLLGEQGASTSGLMIGGTVAGLPGAAAGLAIGTAIGAKGMSAKLIDILTDDRNSKDTLIADFFDQAQEKFSELSGQRYHSTMFGRLFGSFNSTAMYHRGEYFIHMLNVYSVLFHEKVIAYDPNTGKRRKISLYDALEKGEKIEGNAELKLKDNILRIDGKKIVGLNDDYFKALHRRIRYINQQCHGAMNKEDKGLIHQWIVGRLVMNFRQWMVEHYSSRYRQLHWDESVRDVNLSNFYNGTTVLLDGKKVSLIDALDIVDNGTGDGEFHYEIKPNVKTLSGETLTDAVLQSMLDKYAEDAGWRRGFKNDAYVVLRDYIKDYIEYQTKANAYWNSLSETQKADVKQTLGAAAIFLALSGLSVCMGDPDKHKGEYWYRQWLYVVKRVLFDELASSLPGAVTQIKTITQSLIASTQTVSGLIYPIYGVFYGDPWDVVGSGRHKGENKWWYRTKKYTLPFYHQVDQLLNIGEDATMFSTFDGQITR